MEIHKRILLVDDDAVVRYVLRATLQGMGSGYEVVCEPDSRSALAAMSRRSFDLLVTDVVMGAHDGIKLTRQVRGRAPSLPVIWITGHGCRYFAQEGEELGVHCCLDKPVSPAVLRRLVRGALEGNGLDNSQDEVQ